MPRTFEKNVTVTMVRFIFYLAFGYIIMKLLRVFIDPMFDNSAPSQANTRKTNTSHTHPHEAKSTPKEKNTGLGDYVDYEEVN